MSGNGTLFGYNYSTSIKKGKESNEILNQSNLFFHTGQVGKGDFAGRCEQFSEQTLRTLETVDNSCKQLSTHRPMNSNEEAIHKMLIKSVELMRKTTIEPAKAKDQKITVSN